MKQIFSKQIRPIYLMLSLIFSWVTISIAQDKEFWFAAPDDSYEHGGCDRPAFLMISTMDLPSVVEIYIGGTLRQKVTIQPNSFHKEDFSSSADLTLVENSIANDIAGTVQNKGIYIKADNPVTAYYQVDGSCSKDIFTLKGKRALGKHFFTPFQTRYGPRSIFTDAYNHFVIVATEDNTSVTIKTNTQPNPTSGTGAGSIVYRPASEGGSVSTGTSFTITLNKGQTYTVRESVLRAGQQTGNWWAMDKPTLSGTEVNATKPIAITVAEPGTTMASTMPAYPSTDLLGDQIVPVEGLGTNYIAVPGYKSGTAEEWVYLMATEDNTTITVYKPDGTSDGFVFDKGQHWTYLLGNDGLFFLADKPAYCYHQSAADTEMGAAILPSMYSISSRKISFYKQSTGVDHTYLFLIFRKNAESGFTINGKALTVPSSEIKSIPSISDWVYAKVDISSTKEGLCVIENSKSSFALGIFSYLTTTTTSYGFMSDFGYFDFNADTTYKCAGDDITLDAGYASSYAWVLPDGSTAITSNVTSSQEGWYKVTVNQDTYVITDSIYVKDRFGDLNTEIVGSKFREPGNTYKYHVNFRPEYISNVTYEWNVINGSLTQIAPDTIEVAWTDDGIVSLILQDTTLGCRKELYLPVTLYPDNVSDADCYITPPAFDFNFNPVPKKLGEGNIHCYSPSVGGDIDGDGLPELFAIGTTTGDTWYGANVFVFMGTGETKKIACNTAVPGGSIALGRVKTALGDTTLVFLLNMDQYIYAYSYHQGNFVQYWKSSKTVPNTGVHSVQRAHTIGLADFNNDGYAEIYINNSIFDAASGNLLCRASGNEGFAESHAGTLTSITTVGDFNNDGKLELAAGNTVWKVDIDRSLMTGSMSIFSQLTLPVALSGLEDGHTQVVDLDLDGKLDIVVSKDMNGLSYIYIWNPLYNKLIAYGSTPAGYIPGGLWWQGYGKGVPFIGDIDGDKSPEIILLADKIAAFKYDETQDLSLFWELTHTDTSFGTGMTLFDFNQDSISEIVYRDMTHLRIIDGSVNPPQDLAKTDLTSSTLTEYPIVLDIDNDGAAEIVVSGGPPNNSAQGYLAVYKPLTGSWAPARKVWNQYTYNAVNINEDLTIPAYQLNPATVFPGEDGISGTADDVRPYNNFLQQQTPLNKNGLPLWITPNGRIVGSPIYNYQVLPDSMIITIKVENSGDAPFQAPLKISVHKNQITGDKIFTYNYPDPIIPGEAVDITFGIPKFKEEWAKISPFTGIYIRINDDGNGHNHQPVCDSIDVMRETSSIIASDDYALIYKGSTDNHINVLFNDILPTNCTNPVIEILPFPPYSGTASTGNSGISYTPADNATKDTLRYRVHCGNPSNADTAFIYINIIEKPDNISNADCYIKPLATEWKIKEVSTNSASNYCTNQTVLIGDIDADGDTEIIATIATGGTNTSRAAILDHNMKIKNTFNIPTAYFGANPISAIGNVKWDATTGNKRIIIGLSNNTLLLYACDSTGTIVWNSTDKYSTNSNIAIGAPSLIDLDGDGWTEILIGNKVFAAESGKLLCSTPGDGGINQGFGCFQGHMFQTVAADVLGRGNQQICIGNQIYEVNIVDRSGSALNSMTSIKSIIPVLYDHSLPTSMDGSTQIVDFDLDGHPDILVTTVNQTTTTCYMYVWSPHKDQIIASAILPNIYKKGIPLIGDIDGDKYPEIVFMHGKYTCNSYDANLDKITALKYNPLSSDKQLDIFWQLKHNDVSGATGMTLFDFNQDSISEIVYRDNYNLRIINGSMISHFTGRDTNMVYDLATITCGSTTAFEYPAIADIDNDGQAEIVVAGNYSASEQGLIRVFKSAGSPWAPARRVWNQFAYSSINVNDDLTIPKYPLNPATIFPGDDEILGTQDDVHPYNNFLQQQTFLNKNGVPIWLAPDATSDQSLSNASVTGDSVSITIGVMNLGDAAIGSPVYATLYKESVATANKIKTDSANIQIMPGDTGFITIRIQDITPYLPMLHAVIRINDNGTSFTYQPECDDDNNELIMLNPALSLMMEKNATLNGTADNGTYANPVSVLKSENIEYRIKAVNANTYSGTTVYIKDTLPAYLDYVSNSGSPLSALTISTVGTPARNILTWKLDGINSLADTTVYYEATPQEGVCASQPMFVNRAWITASDTLHIVTGNSTYHQGAGVSVVTFSAGLGGQIYGADPQAVDYRSSALEGIIILPEEGYQFTGWSHDNYISLRGENIAAGKGIMHYDTLMIYGNVGLTANFEPEIYPIVYHLNGGQNPKNNPLTYTIESATISLEAPGKDEDIFIGWSGSNGEEPQTNISIPKGSTGGLDFYANFLHSGRENVVTEETEKEDKIWAVNNEVFIRTGKVGSIVRIYSIDGVLQNQQVIITAGETKIKLRQGIYVVTLNNCIGQKIKIE